MEFTSLNVEAFKRIGKHWECALGRTTVRRSLGLSTWIYHTVAHRREELDAPYDIKFGFLQKITFVLRKVNKNCCHQSCAF